ncbi:hypothetical protein DXG03_002726, partial [Asterophora parasitica]
MARSLKLSRQVTATLNSQARVLFDIHIHATSPGARGISLLSSSGDGGVGDGNPDPKTQECFTNDGRNATRFVPIFPAACPYITAVGGTNHVPEAAVAFSGGGFSNYFPRPWYQEAAVGKWIKKFPQDKYKGLFN